MDSNSDLLAVKVRYRTAIAATLATVVLGGMLIAYASLVSTGVPHEIDGDVRRTMVTGAMAATICMIPASLFFARMIQAWRHRGPHPSVSLTLLATVALFPLIFSLLIVFAG